jgi:hypothetical protein
VQLQAGHNVRPHPERSAEEAEGSHSVFKRIRPSGHQLEKDAAHQQQQQQQT